MSLQRVDQHCITKNNELLWRRLTLMGIWATQRIFDKISGAQNELPLLRGYCSTAEGQNFPTPAKNASENKISERHFNPVFSQCILAVGISIGFSGSQVVSAYFFFLTLIAMLSRVYFFFPALLEENDM